MEFYSLMSNEIKGLDIWIHSAQGYYPKPDNKPTRYNLNLFTTIGKFMAKGIVDSRLMDLPLNILLIKMMLDYPVTYSLETLSLIDEILAKSLRSIDENNVSSMCLDFTLPGTHILLKQKGNKTSVDGNNYKEYIAVRILILNNSVGN
jgi:E3 ubiquitin-protein ligase TRIP12